MNLAPYIDNPRLLNRETLVDLQRLTEEYPYYQAARLLYVQNLFMLRQTTFGEQMRRASILIPDRSVLFHIVEEPEPATVNETAKPTKSAILTENEDRTSSLIDDFLSRQQTDTTEETTPHAMPTIADVTGDYASFLAQQADLPQAPKTEDGEADDQTLSPSTRTDMASLIDSFLDSTRGKQRYELPIENEDETDPSIPLPTPPSTEHEDKPIYNEKIVGMLLQQGHYEQALEILRKICLNNPEKSATFATQIHLLEVIVAQQSGKKPKNN